MSGQLFDQYKAALRRGHLAAVAGELENALEAYREAARLVPDRTLPLASQGTVLHRLDRWPEAAEAFERALLIEPDDELTLRARGVAREARGHTSGAAADYERLALVLDVAGRYGDATAAARRAAELETTPDRAALLERLTTSGARAAEPRPGGTADDAGPDATTIASDDPDAEAWPGLAEERLLDAIAALDVQPLPGGHLEGADWPRIDLPTPPPAPIVGPPPDPETVLANATALLDAGDTSAARDLMLMAVLVHRQAGRLDAALDICLQLLGMDPSDAQVHLAIANLQLDQGWTTLATEKIELLGRLTELTGDTQAAADVHGLAAERLRDEPARSAAAVAAGASAGATGAG